MKTCVTCNEEKEVSSFGKNSRNIDNIHNTCRECLSERDAKRYRENPDWKRCSTYRARYGINLEEYNALVKEQGNTCKICSRPNPIKQGNLCVDHCHTTGKIRGLLCFDCNIGLGMFKDNTDLILKATEYLRESRI